MRLPVLATLLATTFGCTQAVTSVQKKKGLSQNESAALAQDQGQPAKNLHPKAPSTATVTKGKAATPAEIKPHASVKSATPAVASAKKKASLLDFASPPDVYDLNGYSISDSEIEVTWFGDGGSTYDYIVSIGDYDSISSCFEGLNTFRTNSNDFYIDNLSQNTTYTVAVCAEDSDGNLSPDALLINVSTYENLPAPENLYAYDVSFDNFYVAWNSAGGATYGYLIQALPGAVANLSCDGGNTTYGTSFQFYDLTPNSTYTVALCAIDSQGYTSDTIWLQVNTGVEPAAPAVIGLAAIGLSTSSIEVAWATGGGSTDHFLVAAAAGAIAPYDCTGGASTTVAPFNVTGLADDTEYAFRVCAVNASGAVETGVTVNARTLSGVANSNWVIRLYEEILGRAPDSAGLASWVGQLNAGSLTRTQIARGFLASVEYRTDIVTGYYDSYLNRAPDASGLASWVNDLLTITQEQVTSGFMESPEYYAKGGGTDSGWVTFLYKDLLGRTPAPAEVQGWLNALNGGETRAQISMGFLTSPEFHKDIVDSWYVLYLCRHADTSGINYWSGLLNAGERREDIVSGILASDEYFGYAQNGGCHAN